LESDSFSNLLNETQVRNILIVKAEARHGDQIYNASTWKKRKKHLKFKASYTGRLHFKKFYK
jgi:hypothetical protein